MDDQDSTQQLMRISWNRITHFGSGDAEPAGRPLSDSTLDIRAFRGNADFPWTNPDTTSVLGASSATGEPATDILGFLMNADWRMRAYAAGHVRDREASTSLEFPRPLLQMQVFVIGLDEATLNSKKRRPNHQVVQLHHPIRHRAQLQAPAADLRNRPKRSAHRLTRAQRGQIGI